MLLLVSGRKRREHLRVSLSGTDYRQFRSPVGEAYPNMFQWKQGERGVILETGKPCTNNFGLETDCENCCS